MARDPDDRKALWASLAVLLGLAALALVLLPRPAATSKARHTPLQTVSLSDGTRIEILALKLGSSIRLNAPPRRGISRIWPRVTHDRRTWPGGHLFKDLTNQTVNRRWQHSELHLHHPGLLIVARALDASGHPLPADIMHAGAFDHPRAVTRDPRTNTFKSMDRVAGKPAPWRLEIGDGGGGWLQCIGPLVPNTEDGRALFFSPVFPRTMPAIPARIYRHDLDTPVPFSLPNPAAADPPPPMPNGGIPDSPPLQRDLPDVRVRITPTSTSWSAPDVRRPEVHATLKSLVPDQLDDDCWRLDKILLSDPLGNRAGLHQFQILPGVHQVGIDVAVRRSRAFRWPRDQSTLLARLTVPEDLFDPSSARIPIPLELLPEATDLGIETLTLAPSAYPPDTPPEDPPTWEFLLTGRAAEPLVRRLVLKSLVVVFEEGQARSFGKQGFSATGGTGQIGSGQRSFELFHPWQGHLSAGQVIEVALPNDTPPTHATFLIPTKNFTPSP